MRGGPGEDIKKGGEGDSKKNEDAAGAHREFGIKKRREKERESEDEPRRDLLSTLPPCFSTAVFTRETMDSACHKLSPTICPELFIRPSIPRSAARSH